MTRDRICNHRIANLESILASWRLPLIASYNLLNLMFFFLNCLIVCSGAGKTTLLNVLNMRTQGNLLVDGEVKINGCPIARDAFVQMSGYVQQDDLFIATLTVREQLIFQVNLPQTRYAHIPIKINYTYNSLL